MHRILFFVLISFILNSCKSYETIIKTDNIIVVNSKKKLDKKSLRNWHHKDILTDTIPGASIEKAYTLLQEKEIKSNIIVAVLDSGLDTSHEDLINNIWENSNEISNNKVDDDKNGYIDDINGWNFLTNNLGENILYENLEHIRVLRKYNHDFSDDSLTNNHNKIEIELYRTALEQYKAEKELLTEDKDYIDSFIKKQEAAKVFLKNYLGTDKYTYQDLKKIVPNGDKELKKHLINRKHALYYEMDEKWIEDFQKDIEVRSKYKINPEYGKEINKNFQGKNRGNNDVIGDLNIETHSTQVVGIIAAKRNNNLGINGVTDQVKIMPIRIVPKGDERDSNVAKGIRYAVDNGAKIINMSFGKYFSSNKELVIEAIKYASKKDVLLVGAAGNDNFNIDKKIHYPIDVIDSTEFSKNLIVVGASSVNLNKNLKAWFSNYGSKNVDIFAPGEDIYTTSPNNEYQTSSGTSLAAPVVSGIAALIRSYYPDLKATQVKEIIMNSGTSYNIGIEFETAKDTKKMVPFSSLSKSGKIVNAYNALLMAEEISKAKKKK